MSLYRDMTPAEIAARDGSATNKQPATNTEAATNTNTRGEHRERPSRRVTSDPENDPKPRRQMGPQAPSVNSGKRSANRRDKAAFNTYQRAYMRKRRAAAKA